MDCAWQSWGPWASCSEACGPGNKMRSRQVSVEAQYGGANCSGMLDETTSCNGTECPGMCTC